MSKVRSDDEGELAVKVSITPDKKALVLDFGKSVAWVGLTKKDVIALCKTLAECTDDMIDSDRMYN